MMKILKILPKNFKKGFKEAIKSIKRGEVVVCPTDTFYGLLGDATNKKAVEKLLKIKKRKAKRPIPIFVKNLKMAKKLAFISKKQEKFLNKVWPGKVTIVLKRKKAKTKLYGVDKKTIALRIPKYKLVADLLKKLNCPLTGTSANISGTRPGGNIQKIIKQFKNKKYQPYLVLDFGNLPESKASTILDLTGKKPKTLRK